MLYSWAVMKELLSFGVFHESNKSNFKRRNYLEFDENIDIDPSNRVPIVGIIMFLTAKVTAGANGKS